MRRFNSAVQKQFKLPPSALRKQLGKQEPQVSVKLQLQYRPPYDWEGVVNFYGRHAIGGVESVTPESYRRNIKLEGAQGHVEVRPLPHRNALQLEVQLSDHSLLMQVVARIRRMFDLDANPAAIHQVLGQDRQLAPLLLIPVSMKPSETPEFSFVGVDTTKSRNSLSQWVKCW